MICPHCGFDPELETQALVVDEAEHRVFVHGEQVPLTFREWALLAFFRAHEGQVLLRDAIYRHAWELTPFGKIKTIDVHIYRLRSKLPIKVETIRNVGFRYLGVKE